MQGPPQRFGKFHKAHATEIGALTEAFYYFAFRVGFVVSKVTTGRTGTFKPRTISLVRNHLIDKKVGIWTCIWGPQFSHGPKLQFFAQPPNAPIRDRGLFFNAEEFLEELDGYLDGHVSE